MGTSLLAMPWGIQQAGPLPAIIITIIIALLNYYSAYLIQKSPKLLPANTRFNEFIDICRILIGRKIAYVGMVFAIITFFGACLVYWVIMSQFLLTTGHGVMDIIHGNISSYHPFDATVICKNTSYVIPSVENGKDILWSEYTVPMYLAVLLFPLLFIDNVVFFTGCYVYNQDSIIEIIIAADILRIHPGKLEIAPTSVQSACKQATIKI